MATSHLGQMRATIAPGAISLKSKRLAYRTWSHSAKYGCGGSGSRAIPDTSSKVAGMAYDVAGARITPIAVRRMGAARCNPESVPGLIATTVSAAFPPVTGAQHSGCSPVGAA